MRPSTPVEEEGSRRDGYPGTSGTSRRLLEHWFLDEHQTPDGAPFRYYFAQREVAETVICVTRDQARLTAR